MSGRRVGAGDEGSMGVEVVLLIPVVLLVGLLVVAMGRYVSAEGDLQAAAREGVRAATLERSSADARLAARSAAESSLTSTVYLDNCAPATLEGAFVPGGTVTVRLDCQVSWNQLGALGLPGTVAVSASSSAPLDVNRRVAP